MKLSVTILFIPLFLASSGDMSGEKIDAHLDADTQFMLSEIRRQGDSCVANLDRANANLLKIKFSLKNK